ncbi:MAG: hypothetical protein JWM59_639 [Verrucomicrobiales bacterium]|nr:hypothetical protein [Verrucomicrobiales bacterium]
MQGQSISKLIIAAVLIIVAVYVVLDVMTSGGNALGKIYGYVMFGSALYGLISPKGAFIYLLVLTGYLDMLKRIMIFDSRVSLGDLYYVLGIAPATMAGILTSVCYALLLGRQKVAKGQVLEGILVITGMATLMGMSLLAMGRSGRALGDVVNMVCYLALLVVVPYLYKTPRDLQKLYRLILLIFIPAAVYMIYQSIVGLAAWEMDYLKSGLTVEIRQLREVKFRSFGTFNSASAAAVVFSLLAVLALTGPWRRRDGEGRVAEGLGSFMSVFCFLLFATASAVTISRTGWVQGAIAFGAMFMFSSKLRTNLFYLITVPAAVSVVVFASWIVKSGWFDLVEGLIRKFVKGDVTLRTVTISTFIDRLMSYQKLVQDGELWTPFGWKLAGKTQSLFVHDAISDLLMKLGYIPLGTIFLFGIYAMWRMHRTVLSAPDPLSRRIGVTSAAFFVGSLSGCLATPAQLYMFPANFLMWLFPAVILSMGYHQKLQQAAAAAPAPGEGAVARRTVRSRAPRLPSQRMIPDTAR